MKVSGNGAICLGEGHEFQVHNKIIDLLPVIEDVRLREEAETFDDHSHGMSGGRKITRPTILAERNHQDVIKIIAESINGQLGNKDIISIGEIGCGHGTGIKFLKELKLKNVFYYGNDLSLNSLKQAAERETLDWHVQLIRGDAHNQLFANDSMDIILSMAALHHLDLERVIPWISRSLKENGMLLLYEPSSCNPLAQAGRKMTENFHTKNERPLKPKEVREIAEDNFLSLLYERGLHSISGPLLWLLGTYSVPFSRVFYSTARIFDNIATSPKWGYEFVQVFIKQKHTANAN